MTRRIGTVVWVLVVFLLATTDSVGEITVIYDNGEARPLAPYMGFADRPDGVKAQRGTKWSGGRPALGAANLNRILPIQSPGLAPGRVNPQSHYRPFARPLFLIGSDPQSRQWLATHRHRLAEIGAVGMLVEAQTVQDLRAIAAIADGLPILPASASDLARTLGVRHYPVLITPDGVEQ